MKIDGLTLGGVGRFLPCHLAAVTVPTLPDPVMVPAAGSEDLPYAMATTAVRDALLQAGRDVEDLNGQYLLVCNEGPGDYLFQLAGRMVLDDLGVGRAHTYSFTQGGNSAVFALYLLACHLANNPDAQRGVVLATQHWKYHSVGRRLGDAALGDGAAAALLERGGAGPRLMAISASSEGQFHDIVYSEVGGWAVPMTEDPCRNGRFVYRVHNERAARFVRAVTVERADAVIARAMDDAGIGWDSVDAVVLDTATPDIAEGFARRFPIGRHRLITPGLGHAWLCSAGIMFALARLLQEMSVPHLQPTLHGGSHVLVISLGIDANWAAAVMEV